MGIDVLSIQVNITMEWVPNDLFDEKSTLNGEVKQQAITWTNVDQDLYGVTLVDLPVSGFETPHNFRWFLSHFTPVPHIYHIAILKPIYANIVPGKLMLAIMLILYISVLDNQAFIYAPFYKSNYFACYGKHYRNTALKNISLLSSLCLLMTLHQDVWSNL